MLNHPNAVDLYWGTLALFGISFFNMIILTKIMKKYTIFWTTLNTMVMMAGIMFRFQPADKTFKLTFT